MEVQQQPQQDAPPPPKAKKPLLNTKMVKKQKMQSQKEENLREILNFFINQVNVRKFLQKMKATVDSTKQEEKIQDDFLNPNEYLEIKGIYDDYNMGDLVIVFANPDADGVKNMPITYKEAEKIYDDVLTQKNDDVSEAYLKKEKEAFMLSFLTLDDYEDEKTKKKRKEEEEKIKKEQASKKEHEDSDDDQSDLKSVLKDKSISENQQQKKNDQATEPKKKRQTSTHSKNQGELNKAEAEAEKIEVSDLEIDFDQDKMDQEVKEEKEEKEEKGEEPENNEAKPDLTTYEKYLEFMKKYNKIQKEKQEREEKEQKRKAKKQIQSQTPQDQKKSPLTGKQQIQHIESETNPSQIQQQQQNPQEELFQLDPIKELLKVKLSDQKQFRKVKKQFSQGEYLVKVKEGTKIIDWVCTNQPPKDFMTLIRFAVIEKLTRNAFLHCRQFISSNGAQILVVVKSTKEIIMRQAQKIKVTKQVELGFADLFSLEPVDIKLRPLRLKKYLRSYQSGSEEDQKIQAKLQEEAKENKSEKVAALKPGQTVEDHCKQLYPKVCHWEDFDLRLNIIKKQQEVDKIIKKIVFDLNIDQSQEKSEILNDEEISKEEWQTYYIYLESLFCFGEWISDLKSKGAHEVKDNQAFLYKLVFRKALADANQFWFDKNKSFWKDVTGNNCVLFNLWGRLQIDPIAPYTEFFLPSGEAAKSMWRKYEVNEKNLRSEFLNMEKIKLTNAIILKHINILMMLQKQYALIYIPLHDQYQLNGLPKSLLFQNLQDNEFIKKQEQTQGDKMLKTIFVQLKSQAEPTDYDSISVEKDSSFNIKQPWHIPIQTMRDYFGEKIAIYFLFLTFYTKQLWYLSIVGIIFQGLSSASAPGLQDTLTVMFSVLIIIWSTFFIEYWKQEQVLFSLQYGQQNLEQDSAERPAFKGKFIRSITMDNLNEQFYSPLKRQITQLLAFGLSLLIISMAIGCVLGIMFFKNLMIEINAGALLSQTVPGILNSIQINFFTKVYFIVASQFNILENHKILSTYENSLVVKDFIFRFVNNFNSFFIISFLSGFFPNLYICKVNEQITNDCFQLLTTQLTTIFSSNLTGSLPQLIVPFVKLFAMTQLKNLMEEKQPQYPFDSIDRYIEDQLGLDPYQTNEEVDGSVQDYMLITIQFAYLVLFGVSFPACYLMAFAQNILRIQVDKMKFLKFARRPFPQGASSIGNWLVLLDIITFIGIFVNAGLIVFTSGFITSNQELYFPLVLVSFLVLKYIIRFIIPSYPESASILNARHKCILEKAVKGFTDEGGKYLIKTNVYSKIGGVQYVSDLSELCVDEEAFEQEKERIMKQVEFKVDQQ